MSAIADLNAAVTRLTSSVSAELKAISNTLANEPSDADIQQAALAINGLSDKLDAETAALTAGAAPAPGSRWWLSLDSSPLDTLQHGGC